MDNKGYNYDIKDYGTEGSPCHHYTVPSMFAKQCKEEYRMQPSYCEPGEAGINKSSKAEQQVGP